MLAAMYVYGMGRTEMCGYGVVWWPVAKWSCDMCMSRLRKVKHGVLHRLGSKPSPLLTSKRAENAACCRCMWLRLPAWKMWLALLVVMYVYGMGRGETCMCSKVWWPVASWSCEGGVGKVICVSRYCER